MPPLTFPRAGRQDFTPAEQLAIDTPGVVDTTALADAIQALIDGTTLPLQSALEQARAEQARSIVPTRRGAPKAKASAKKVSKKK